MAPSETLKYSAEVVDTAENVSHCHKLHCYQHFTCAVDISQVEVCMNAHTSQLTTIFNKTSCARPMKRLL